MKVKTLISNVSVFSFVPKKFEDIFLKFTKTPSRKTITKHNIGLKFHYKINITKGDVLFEKYGNLCFL
jgi:hypothetical protein